MVILITIYGMLVIGSLGDPLPDLGIYSLPTEASKTVNMPAMKGRIEALLRGELDNKSKDLNSRSMKGNAEIQRTEKRNVMENVKQWNRLKPRSLDEVTDKPQQPQVATSETNSSEADTPSTKMSHIMRIDPRERRSEFQLGGNRPQKREISETARPTEQKPMSTPNPQENVSATVKQGDNTQEHKSEAVTEVEKLSLSGGSTITTTATIVAEATSNNNTNSAETQAPSASGQNLQEYSDYSNLKEPGESEESMEAGQKKRKEKYTFPPRFFRHKNFFREVTFEEGKPTAEPQTTSGATTRETPGSIATQETQVWQDSMRPGGKGSDYDPGMNLDIRYLGGNDLPIGPVGSKNKVDSSNTQRRIQDVDETEEKEVAVAAVPGESIQNTAHFVIIVAISLVALLVLKV